MEERSNGAVGEPPAPDDTAETALDKGVGQSWKARKREKEAMLDRFQWTPLIILAGLLAVPFVVGVVIGAVLF